MLITEIAADSGNLYRGDNAVGEPVYRFNAVENSSLSEPIERIWSTESPKAGTH